MEKSLDLTYRTTFSLRRLWLIFACSMLAMFATLLWFGREIYHQAPPMPTRVVSVSGATLFTRAEIERGQNVWQSTGGMQQGSLCVGADRKVSHLLE